MSSEHTELAKRLLTHGMEISELRAKIIELRAKIEQTVLPNQRGHEQKIAALETTTDIHHNTLKRTMQRVSRLEAFAGEDRTTVPSKNRAGLSSTRTAISVVSI